MSAIRYCSAAVAAALAVSLFARPALAGASELRAALSEVPAPVLISADALLAGFVGLRDLRELPAFKAPKPARMTERLYPAVSSDAVQALLRNDVSKTEDNWRDKTGLPMSEPASFLNFGAPPATITIWRFDGKDGPQSFLDGLTSRGFVKAPDGSVSNGEPLKMDFAKRDEANPFTGSLGRASTLAPVAGGVAQSYNPRYVAALRQVTGPAFTSLPPVDAALDGLEKVVGNAPMPQAVVLGAGAWTPDVGGIVAERDPSAPPRLPEPGAPPAVVAVVADVETTDARRGAVFAIGYPDCDTAAKAGARFARSWRGVPDGGGKTPRERTGAEPVTQEVANDQSCAAVISLTVPVEGKTANPVYRYILDSLMRRDFKALQGK